MALTPVKSVMTSMLLSRITSDLLTVSFETVLSTEEGTTNTEPSRISQFQRWSVAYDLLIASGTF